MPPRKTTSGKSAPRRSTARKAPAKKSEDPIAQEASDRIEAYRALAGRIASRDDKVRRPKQLTGHDRRVHVRSTIREDHALRISRRSYGAKAKFDTLADDLFKFFRGTALLFYRDMVGEDGDMPTVMALGDVHPSNFGIMPDENGAPIFGVNDFDESIYAPFTWDLRRGAVGFFLAARLKGDLKRKKARKVVAKFVKGYLKAMERYAADATEKNDAWRMDNSPKIVRKLFEEAWEERKAWLWDDYLSENGRGFRPDDELQPLSSEVPKFQKAINSLARKNKIKKGGRAGALKVKDVCVRHGQGTASLGLPRYYVLLEGPSEDATDDLIIEFKTARLSALEGLTPPSEFNAGEKAERIAHAQSVQLAHGDVFYGSIAIEGESYMTRERAPFRDDIDLGDLKTKQWKAYATACGAALAQSHALSDDLGQVDYDMEPAIGAAASPRKLFVADLLALTEEAVDRLKRDHAMFREDHALGAFDEVEMVYR